MLTLNNVLNQIDSIQYNENAGFFKREISSRLLNLFVTTPSEIAAIAENILFTPVYAVSALIKTGAKVITHISGSESVNRFEKKLPGFAELLVTIARIVAYTIGTALTLTFGAIISPKTNFDLHCDIGLAQDERILALPITPLLEKSREIKEEELKQKQLTNENAKLANENAKLAEENEKVEAENAFIKSKADNEAEKITYLLQLLAKEQESLQDELSNKSVTFIKDDIVKESVIDKVEDIIQDVKEIVKNEAEDLKVNTNESQTVKTVIIEEESITQPIESNSIYNLLSNTASNTMNAIIHPINTAEKIYNTLVN